MQAENEKVESSNIGNSKFQAASLNNTVSSHEWAEEGGDEVCQRDSNVRGRSGKVNTADGRTHGATELIIGRPGISKIRHRTVVVPRRSRWRNNAEKSKSRFHWLDYKFSFRDLSHSLRAATLSTLTGSMKSKIEQSKGNLQVHRRTTKTNVEQH